jgi:hypothetical protein
VHVLPLYQTCQAGAEGVAATACASSLLYLTCCHAHHLWLTLHLGLDGGQAESTGQRRRDRGIKSNKVTTSTVYCAVQCHPGCIASRWYKGNSLM